MHAEQSLTGLPLFPPHLIERFQSGPNSARVLLLTSGLGVGHVRAAQAVQAALVERGVRVRCVDLWSLMNPGVAEAIQQAYLELVLQHSTLWERLYQLDEHTWRQILQSESGPPADVLEVLELISAIAAKTALNMPRGGRYGSDRLLLSLLCAALPYDADSLAGNGARARLALLKWTWLRLIRRLEPAIRDFAPDAIISTQMIPAAMVSFLKQRRKLDVPVLGVVTDFGVHDFWKQPGVDAYCVAHQSIATAMADSCGFADVVATGVPLMPGFAALPSQAEARRQLQLPADVPVVLVLGGGLGLSVDTAAAHLLDRQSETHLIVMPGRNANMQKSLASLTARQPQRLRVCEWTEQMQLFIRASDLIVGKPGGVTVAEALACGRPLLATRSLGGQEGFNVRFLEQHDVGGLVPDGELLQGVDALIHDRERLLQMQRHAWLLGHREGAQRVAALTLELIFEHQQNRFAARL